MKNEKRSDKSIYKTLAALLILLSIYTAVMPETAAAQNSSAPNLEAGNQNLFAARFRAGRDLIDRQEWARAGEQFRAAIEKYPDHKLADAALYWLAFCHKKQKKFAEADAALNRLLKEFPASSWTGDAQVMKLEIAPSLGRLDDSGNINTNLNLAREQLSADIQANIVKGAVTDSLRNINGQTQGLADALAADKVTLERADEIKIAAFQSLLVAAPKKAIETTGEILKPDSKASEALKQQILRVWRNPRLFASQALTSDISKNIGAKEFFSLLRETLVRSFQNETNLKIRKEIIYTLAGLDDSGANDYLKKLYAAEGDREIKKAIINSFSSSAKIFYAFSSSADPKQLAALDASREQIRKIEFDFLLEIVRTEKDVELRQMAFSNLRRFQNWWTTAPAVEVMKSLYDAESDEEFKLAVIRAFAESKQASATGKLLDIAKNDKSDKLRLEAIYWLRTSKDPEVLKFLEDLIK